MELSYNVMKTSKLAENVPDSKTCLFNTHNPHHDYTHVIKLPR